MSDKKAAVIGAGITGLVAAYKLQQAGFHVDLFEKNSGPGGSVKSVIRSDWLTEFGPNTMLLKDASVKNFLIEIGMHNKVLEASPEASKRFIVKDGELQALPGSMAEALTTSLFSFKAKLRVCKEPFISKNRGGEETVADFVERRLGRELLDYGINPFVAGIFANNPEDLSLKYAFPAMHRLEQDYGSLILGAVSGKKRREKEGRIPRKLISFYNGLQELPEKIASRLSSIRYKTAVRSIIKNNNGWHISSENNDSGPYKHVVVNVPLYMWNKKLMQVEGYDENLPDLVHYPPLSVLHLGYRIKDIEHPLDGFGFLVPEIEKRKILGALFSSTLFDNRAPDGHHLLTLFIGGGRQPDLAGKSTEHLFRIAEKELKDLIGLKSSAVFKEHVFWPMAIPGYHVGYGRVLKKFDYLEQMNEGLHIAGNFRNGISLPDCIKNGIAVAQRIISKGV